MELAAAALWPFNKVDDTLGVVHTHGVAGLLGGLLVGVLADPNMVIYLGNGKNVNDVTASGWLWGHHPHQILVQFLRGAHHHRLGCPRHLRHPEESSTCS